jgi:hypothetical protein
MDARAFTGGLALSAALQGAGSSGAARWNTASLAAARLAAVRVVVDSAEHLVALSTAEAAFTAVDTGKFRR